MKYVKAYERVKRRKMAVKCVCGNTLTVEVGGRYESIIVPCPKCNKNVEFKKEEIDNKGEVV